MFLCAFLSLGATSSAIEWSELTVKAGDRPILKDVHGRATPGRLVAIMGPSGSGKSTLLKAISGKLTGSKVSATGIIEGDDPAAAFVQQDELFYEYSTVMETLMFAARLKLPDQSRSEQTKRCEEALAKTGLSKQKNSLVATCSGGERKRLALARALIDNPTTIFVDEPTSGLDSFSAERVARSLKAFAEEGRTVICVIHQPSAGVFDLFDDLILLSQGRLMYRGSTKKIDSFFRSLGYSRPHTASLAEHAVATVSLDFETEKRRQDSENRLQKVEDKAASLAKRKAKAFSPPKSSLAATKKKTASPFEQFRLLYKRASQDVMRAKGANAIKAVQQLGTALIYGSIYNFDDSQSSIQDRFGLLSLAIIGSTNLALASSQKVFVKEKKIFQAENSLYGAFPYLLSKIASELPLLAILSGVFGAVIYPLTGLQRKLKKFFNFFGVTTLNTVASSALGLLIGAIAPSQDAALALFPVLIVLNVVFNGLSLDVSKLPKLIKWLPACSVVRWGFEGLVANEFEGIRFQPRKKPAPPGAVTGREALERLNLQDATVKRACTAQGLIVGGCYLQTYRTLRNSKANYVKVMPPPRLQQTTTKPAASRAFFWR